MSKSVIAIDGPAASGKSTVARRVAAALRRIYVDSGALYRGVTWQALEQRVDPRDAAAVTVMLDRLVVTFRVADGAVVFAMGGVEPGEVLRGREVNASVSYIAAMPEVRARVNAWLRDMVKFGDLVMEGRDIGSVVFPATPHKFYLDASPEERARRRHAETQGGGSVKDVGALLQKRDTIDSTRKSAPLTHAEGAMRIDSTGMAIDEVVRVILDAV